MNAQELIDALDLSPLPLEGGYFKETYRSETRVANDAKHLATAIYYLITPDTFSSMHRLPSDEIFHFYGGDPVEMLILHPRGKGELVTLGSDVIAGQHPQWVVPAGSWQGTVLHPGGHYALLGTTMAPGFDFADFESGTAEELTREFPSFRDPILRRVR